MNTITDKLRYYWNERHYKQNTENEQKQILNFLSAKQHH